MESDLQRKLHLRLRMQTLDLLASWPLRHGISCVLLVAALLMVWSIIPHKAKTAATISNVSGTIPAPTDSGVVAQQVASLHLFGTSAMEAATTSVAPVANVKVEGLIYSDDEDSALAILNVNGKSDFFKVGDTLPDGEKLAAISPTSVQLIQGMAQRVVEMPANFGGPGDGIMLAGNTGLGPNGAQFPGFASSSDAQTYQPSMRIVSVPDGASPLDQLRSLRQQLIAQQPEPAPLDAAKHPAKP